MELWKKQKKIGIAFCIFLSLMFLCTLISRAVYASKLPQITTEKPERTALAHKVEAEGIVEEGMEYAVNTLSGLRCKTVHAHVGDKVTTETLLFEIDMEDLQEQIKEQEMTIKKLSLTIQEQEQNKNLAAGQKKTEQDRAQEDYDRTAEDAQGSVDRAKEDLKSAREALDSFKNNPASITSDAERQKAQAEYDAWEKKRTELQNAYDAAQKEQQKAEEEVKRLKEEGKPENDADLKAAQERAKDAESARKQAEETYNTHMENPKTKPDYSSEDEKKSSLENSIGAAERTLEEARKNRDNALLEAKRQLDDSQQASAADNSLAINRLELSVLKEKLEKYQEIQRTGGAIYPKSGGIVTRIQVSPGERIPDGAAVVYADLNSPLELHVTFTKDQKKYVNQGDTANLSLGKSKESVTVDYIAASEINPELFEAIIFLPQGVGTLGQSGIFTTETQTDIFTCCIPIDALYTDENGRNYVYTLKEKSGILGPELAAELVYVNVLDKNDKYAALEEGIIDSETEVITSTTEALTDRTIVRYKE